MKINVPVNLLITGTPSYNEYISQRWNTARMLGASASTSGSTATLDISDANAGFVTFDDVSAVVEAGGEVVGFQAFLAIADGDAAIPDCSLPSIDVVSQDGSTTRKTWKEWKTSNHDYWEDEDGNTWLGSNCATGVPLTGSELMAAAALPGVTLKTVAEFVSMRDI